MLLIGRGKLDYSFKTNYFMIKRIVFYFLIAVSLIGCCKTQEDVAVITGTWNRGNTTSTDIGPTTVVLYKLVEGRLEQIATSETDENQQFGFAFTPVEEGFYTVGLDQWMLDSYSFYLKPGDRLNVEIDKETYKLTGDVSKENQEMECWHDFILPLEKMAVYFDQNLSTYVDFFPVLEQKLEEMKTYKQKYTSNLKFNEAFQAYQQFDMLMDALMCISTPRTAHPQEEDYPEFYRETTIEDLTKTPALLLYPHAIPLLLLLESNKYSEDMNHATTEEEQMKAGENSLPSFLSVIGDANIKGEVVAGKIDGLRSLDNAMKFEAEFGKYLITDRQKKTLEAKKASLVNFSRGATAFDFKFPDIKGKEIALSDLKGKLVYVDVWATWCGPCRQEIPYLKKMEKAYHGKDIVFLSVSIDADKDLQKWKDCVKNENLQGIQLFAGNLANSTIMEAYKIQGIPRFMLFDKESKIISVDAPRPSSDELKALLDLELSRK
jgi:thiol-disulfide isomerase/thioredoxin